MKSRGLGPQNWSFLDHFGTKTERSGASQDPGIPLYGSSMVPEGLPGVPSGSHRGGHIVASLYIPSRARVGRIGSDSMIHILQSVTFGMSGFGLLTLFCEMFQTGEIRGPQNDAIWDPFGTPKWTPFGTPKWDPFWALFWTPK